MPTKKNTPHHQQYTYSLSYVPETSQWLAQCAQLADLKESHEDIHKALDAIIASSSAAAESSDDTEKPAPEPAAAVTSADPAPAAGPEKGTETSTPAIDEHILSVQRAYSSVRQSIASLRNTGDKNKPQG